MIAKISKKVFQLEVVIPQQEDVLKIKNKNFSFRMEVSTDFKGMIIASLKNGSMKTSQEVEGALKTYFALRIAELCGIKALPMGENLVIKLKKKGK